MGASYKFLTPDTLPSGLAVYRTMALPADTYVQALVTGALWELCLPENWEPWGAVSPEDAALYFSERVDQYLRAEWTMIGMVMPYASATPPPGCLACDGATYERVEYPLLYAVLDPAFIVDEDHFVVPDLTDRFVAGAGGTIGDPGVFGGEASVVISQDNLPDYHLPVEPHTHSALPHVHGYLGAVETPDLAGELPLPGALAAPLVSEPADVELSAADVSVTLGGGGESLPILPPFLALRWCIVAGHG